MRRPQDDEAAEVKSVSTPMDSAYRFTSTPPHDVQLIAGSASREPENLLPSTKPPSCVQEPSSIKLWSKATLVKVLWFLADVVFSLSLLLATAVRGSALSSLYLLSWIIGILYSFKSRALAAFTILVATVGVAANTYCIVWYETARANDDNAAMLNLPTNQSVADMFPIPGKDILAVVGIKYMESWDDYMFGVGPDVLILVSTSVHLYFIYRQRKTQDAAIPITMPSATAAPSSYFSKEALVVILRGSELIVLVSLLLCAFSSPGYLGALYYLVFTYCLVVWTFWSPKITRSQLERHQSTFCYFFGPTSMKLMIAYTIPVLFFCHGYQYPQLHDSAVGRHIGQYANIFVLPGTWANWQGYVFYGSTLFLLATASRTYPIYLQLASSSLPSAVSSSSDATSAVSSASLQRVPSTGESVYHDSQPLVMSSSLRHRRVGSANHVSSQASSFYSARESDHSDDSPHESEHAAIVSAQDLLHQENLVVRIFLEDRGVLGAIAAAIFWCVSYPSHLLGVLFGMALVTLGTYGLVIPRLLLLVLNLYAVVVSVVTYALDVPILVSFQWVQSQKALLGVTSSQFPLVDLSIHHSCLIVMCFCLRIRLRYRDLLRELRHDQALERLNAQVRISALSDMSAADTPSRVHHDNFQPHRMTYLELAALWFKDMQCVLVSLLDTTVLFTIFVTVLSTSVNLLQTGYLMLAAFVAVFQRLRRRMWRYLLAYTLVVCFLMYIWNVVCPTSFDQTTMETVGLTCFAGASPASSWNVLWPTLFIAQLILIVQVVIQLVIYMKSDSGRPDRDAMMRQAPGRPIYFISRLTLEVDLVFRLVGGVVAYAGFLFLGFVYEVDADGRVTLIGLLQVLLMFTLLGSHMGSMVKSPRGNSTKTQFLWRLVLVYEGIVLVLRYIYQFRAVEDFIRTHWHLTNVLTIEDFGLKRYSDTNELSGLFAYLFPTALLAAVTAWHLRSMKRKLPTYEILTPGRSVAMDGVVAVMAEFKRMVFVNSPIVLLLFNMGVVCHNINAFNVTYLSLLLATLFKPKWTGSWKSLFWLSSFFVLCLYAFQARSLQPDKLAVLFGSDFAAKVEENANWFGLARINKTLATPSSTSSSTDTANGGNYFHATIWSMTWQHLVVMLLCVVTRASHFWDPDKDKPVGRRRKHHQQPKRRETFERWMAADAEDADEYEDGGGGAPLLKSLQDFSVRFVSQGSVTLTMLVLLVSAFVHLNSISVVYLVVVRWILAANPVTVCRNWTYLAIMLVFVCVTQYFVMLWLPPFMNRPRQSLPPWTWFEFVYQEYFALNFQHPWGLFCDYMCLLVVFMIPGAKAYYLEMEQREGAAAARAAQLLVSGHVDSPPVGGGPVPGDVHDFTIDALRNQRPWRLLVFVVMNYWVFVLLVVVFVSGCVRSGVTSGIYLAFAIYMLLHVHAVDDPQSKMLSRLRDVSWGYLFLLILFQLPVFSDVTDRCEIGTNSQSDGVCLSLPAVLDFNKLPKNYPGAPPLHSNLPILSILIFWMTNIQELIFRSPMYDYVRAYTRRQQDQSHDRRKALHAEVLLDRLERWTALKQEKQAAILRLKAIISRMVNKVEEMMDIASGLNYSLPPSAPLAPTIVPHETTQNAVTVTWSPPPGPLLHRIRYYVVTRQVYPPTTLLGDYTDPVEVKAAAAASSSGGVPTRVVVDGLRPGTSYQFKVSAASRMGEGPFSAPSAPIQTIPLNWGGTCLAGWVQYHKQRWPAPWTSRLWFHAKMLPRYAVIDSHAFVWYKNEAMALKHRSMKKRKRMKTSFLTRDVSLCDLSESTYGLAQVYAIHVVAIARNAHQVRYTIQLETADDLDRWVVELGSLVPRHAVGDRLEAYLEAKGVPLPPLEQMGMADDDDDEDGHRSEWSSVTGDESWLSDAEDEELCESRNIAALVYLAVYSFFYSLQDASMRHESQVYEEDDEMVPSWYEMLTMIINAFRSNSRNVCCVAFLCSFVFQGDLLNVVYVFAAFGFLLVENPRPHSLAWHVLMRYSFWVVCARYLFQLPFFCQNINTNSVLYPSIQPWCPDTLDVPKTRSAIQPMVYFGLYKFDGIANPDVDTMWRGVAWNFVVILCILFHRRELQLRGMWHKSVDHQHASTSADATSSAFDHINQARHTLMSRDSLDDMDAFDVANFLARHDHDADDVTDAKPAPVASTTTKPVVSSSKAVAFSIERQNSIADNVVADDLMEDAGGGETGRGLSDGREAVEDLPDRRPVSPREALLRAQYARLQQQDSLQHPYLRQEDEEGADRQLTSSESPVYTQDTPTIMSPREALLRRMVSTSPPAPPSPASPLSSPRDMMLLRTSSQHSGPLVRNGSSEQLDENEVPPVLVDQPPPVSTTPIDLSKRHPKLVDKLCRRYPSAMAFVGRLWPPTPPHWDKDMAIAMLCPKPGRDYLAVMLLLPFVCIVYAFVFFKYFGEPLRDDSFAINASDSMLNGYMVLIVLFELTVMMWDRAAYVVGSVKLKVALHVTVLVGVHVGLWIMLPSYSQSYLPARPGLQGFYLLHCGYLWCSAYQIKHGYLVFRSNHYSKKSVHETSFADEMCGKLFKVYMFVPFAFEIRCLLDWMCSTTCLNKDMWLLLEETAATLFLVRQEMDERIRDAAYLKGTKRVPVAGKFVSGGVILVVMLLCVVAPLAMFSSLNPTTIENEITSTVVTLGLVQADGTVQQLYINGDTNSDRFTGLNIKASDTVIQKTSYASYSNEIWASSPPLRRNLVARLNSTEMLQWSLRFSFTRDGPDGNQVVATSFEAEMTPMDRALLMNMVLNHGSTADPVRAATSHNATTTHLVLSTSNQTSISVTADTITMPSIRIKNFYTPVIKVGAQTNPVPRRNYMMRDLDIQRNAEDGVSWWVVRSPDPVGNDKLNGIAVKCFDGSGADKDGFCLVTISDNIVAGLTTLGIGSYGLTAVYIFVVFTVGAFFKDMLRGAMYKVLYEELPNPNDLLELVEGVYIARKEEYVGHLKDEGRLYETLIRMLRSPETLVKLTGSNSIHIPHPKEKTD